MKAWDEQGMVQLRDLVRGPGQFTKQAYDNGLTFLEKRLPDGRGVRFEGSNEVAVVFGDADVDATDRQDVVTKLAADKKTRLFSRDKIGPLVTV